MGLVKLSPVMGGAKGVWNFGFGPLFAQNSAISRTILELVHYFQRFSISNFGFWQIFWVFGPKFEPHIEEKILCRKKVEPPIILHNFY